jgi:hypothetical protein
MPSPFGKDAPYDRDTIRLPSLISRILLDPCLLGETWKLTIRRSAINVRSILLIIGV